MGKHIFIILLSIFFCPYNLFSKSLGNQNDSLLNELDKIIIERNIYHNERQQRIDKYKQSLNNNDDNKIKYKYADLLFLEYLHYQADSALYYVSQKEKIAHAINDSSLQDEIHINHAEVYGMMSMYCEAEKELKKVNTKQLNNELLTYYYHTCRAYNGWAADYTPDKQCKLKYIEQTKLYRDSILLIESSPIEQAIVMSEKMILDNNEDEAIKQLNKLNKQELSLRYQAYLNYTLYEIYRRKADTTNQIKYLTLTAINDMKMAVREYASLQKLALMIYLQGDYKRAYNYLNCSMEDAVACNARLRFIEVAEFYPIIDNAYKLETENKHRTSINLLIIISTLALLFIIALIFLYRWMKKISIMKEQLHITNQQLINVNKDLAETGRIKEAYIAHYLNRCVNYIDKQEQYRRSLEKLAMASKLEELFKHIKSQDIIREERKEFYIEFDKTFLDLFPNFVTDFNNLLIDDKKIFLKNNENLNTELRIFALIRLGVTDASYIAHFLGYSLTTVYNYRSKMRNRAKGDKDLFEQQVMNL